MNRMYIGYFGIFAHIIQHILIKAIITERIIFAKLESLGDTFSLARVYEARMKDAWSATRATNMVLNQNFVQTVGTQQVITHISH